ncbi:hypothetical protein D3C75_391970 [compost metagenome]
MVVRMPGPVIVVEGAGLTAHDADVAVAGELDVEPYPRQFAHQEVGVGVGGVEVAGQQEDGQSGLLQLLDVGGQGVDITGLIGLGPALVHGQLQPVEAELMCLGDQRRRRLIREIMGAGPNLQSVHDMLQWVMAVSDSGLAAGVRNGLRAQGARKFKRQAAARLAPCGRPDTGACHRHCQCFIRRQGPGRRHRGRVAGPCCTPARSTHAPWGPTDRPPPAGSCPNA